MGVFPNYGATLAEAHTHGGEAIANVRALLKLAGQLNHQSHPGCSQGVTDSNRSAPRVHTRVIIGNSVVIQETQNLDGKGLIELE